MPILWCRENDNGEKVCEEAQGRMQGAATAAIAAPEMAHINFQSWVFVFKNAVNKILKLGQK